MPDDIYVETYQEHQVDCNASAEAIGTEVSFAQGDQTHIPIVAIWK